MAKAETSGRLCAFKNLLEKPNGDLAREAKDLKDKRDNLFKPSKAKDDKERLKLTRELVGITDAFGTFIDAISKVRSDPEAIRDTKFEWPEDAGLLASQSQVVDELIDQISKNLGEAIEEGEAILTVNIKWMAWATKASGLDLQAINKITRAKVPR